MKTIVDPYLDECKIVDVWIDKAIDLYPQKSIQYQNCL